MLFDHTSRGLQVAYSPSRSTSRSKLKVSYFLLWLYASLSKLVSHLSTTQVVSASVCQESWEQAFLTCISTAFKYPFEPNTRFSSKVLPLKSKNLPISHTFVVFILSNNCLKAISQIRDFVIRP